jgi:hypothetical protein
MTEEDKTAQQNSFNLDDIMKIPIFFGVSCFDNLKNAHTDLQNLLNMPIAPIYFTVVTSNIPRNGWTVKCVIRPCTKPITVYGTGVSKYDASVNAAKSLHKQMLDIILALNALGPVVEGQVKVNS